MSGCDKKAEEASQPSFTAFYEQRLSINCKSCHTGASNVDAGGATFDLSDRDTAYNSILAGMASGTSIQGICVDIPLIEKGNAAVSYFVAIFETSLNQSGFANQPNCTPYSGHINDVGIKLTEAELDDLVSWINSGAPNN